MCEQYENDIILLRGPRQYSSQDLQFVSKLEITYIGHDTPWSYEEIDAMEEMLNEALHGLQLARRYCIDMGED